MDIVCNRSACRTNCMQDNSLFPSLVKPEKNLTRVFKTASQRFQAVILQKQTNTKTRKRKRMTAQYNESDVFTNCVKTYRKTLNCQILEQKLFFNDGIKNLPMDCTVTKKQLKEIKKKSSTESKLKFALVPFSSVLERNFKIGLQLSAFAQMFTYILYCPDIVKCPWLLQMIPMNMSRPKLTSLKMPSWVECFVLLHSLIVIDMKELEAINLKVQKNVTDDEMDDDIYTQEMSDFSSPPR